MSETKLISGTKLEVVTETEFNIVAEYRSFELSAETDAEAKAKYLIFFSVFLV
jgi:hypothetical protein